MVAHSADGASHITQISQKLNLCVKALNPLGLFQHYDEALLLCAGLLPKYVCTPITADATNETQIHNMQCDDGSFREFEVVPFNDGAIPTEAPVSFFTYIW